MPSHREIARDWGTSPSYVDQCCKRGCPTDTFENARLWRTANTTRAPKAKKPNGQKTIEELADQLDLDKEASTIPEAEDIVRGARRCVVEARRLLMNAFIEEKPSKISTYLNLSGKATEYWIKAESILSNKKKEAGILVSLSDAMAMARKPIEILIQRISALPQNTAARVNPHNPGHAMDILQQECIAMVADAQKALLP